MSPAREDLARNRGVARRTEARLIRLTPAELAAWQAGVAAGETLSSMVRAAVDRELERRREAQALEEKTRPPVDLARVNERLVERVRQ